MSNNIKVVVKVRPLIEREIEEKLIHHWRVDNNTLYQIDQHGKPLLFNSSFTFDKVYDTDCKTSDIYNDIAKPIVEAASKGINGTIFAYGQTSSGKTYTMTGTDDSPGIIQLAVNDLFNYIKGFSNRDFLLRVSYIEIYNEQINDLLNLENKNIKLHTTNIHGFKTDATEQVTTTPEEMLKIMRQGEVNRQQGATNMNEMSSRSHSIFQITIESREHLEDTECSVNVSQLYLVDLAGSERAGQTGATGLRFKEGTHINKSLSTLALVIKQLSEENGFTNYRDSKLTRILQNSLGGNANTSIICAITPANIEETTSTLQFANRAKAVKNQPVVNAVETKATMIQGLINQIFRLKIKLESKMNVEQDNKVLMNKLKALEGQILIGERHDFQRSSGDVVSSNRRKTWCAPRRPVMCPMQVIDEDVPSQGIFNTPALKYNLAMLAQSTDFKAIDGPAAVMTSAPQPLKKNVCFNDEIIEIDSDEDEDIPMDPKICSPYHKCYESKTPPCVLREKAFTAERNCADLIELTTLEKLYEPNVAQLMEKLKHTTDVVHSLNIKCEEQQTSLTKMEADILKRDNTIKQITEDKEKLMKQCQECNTKVAECELSIEILKNKFKGREQELLSMLNEQNSASRHTDNLKSEQSIIFMDLSSDVTLVDSEDELCVNVTPTKSTNTIIRELKKKITSKHKQIALLENENEEIKKMCNALNDDLKNITKEKKTLLSEIDALNLNMTCTQDKLINDNQSYVSLVNELLLQMNERKPKLGKKVNEMINIFEEKLLTSNKSIEKCKQIIKQTYATKNEEIQQLKMLIDSTESNYKLQMEKNEKQNLELSLELEKLRFESKEKHTDDSLSFLKIENKLNDSKVQMTNETNPVFELELHNILDNESQIYDSQIQLQNLQEEENNIDIKLNDSNEKILEVKENKITDLELALNKLQDAEAILNNYEIQLKEKDEQIEQLHNELKYNECKITEMKMQLCEKMERITTLELLTNDMKNNIAKTRFSLEKNTSIHIKEILINNTSNTNKKENGSLCEEYNEIKTKNTLREPENIESDTQQNEINLDHISLYYNRLCTAVNKVNAILCYISGDIANYKEESYDDIEVAFTNLNNNLICLEKVIYDVFKNKEAHQKNTSLVEELGLEEVNYAESVGGGECQDVSSTVTSQSFKLNENMELSYNANDILEQKYSARDKQIADIVINLVKFHDTIQNKCQKIISDNNKSEYNQVWCSSSVHHTDIPCSDDQIAKLLTSITSLIDDTVTCVSNTILENIKLNQDMVDLKNINMTSEEVISDLNNKLTSLCEDINKLRDENSESMESRKMLKSLKEEILTKKLELSTLSETTIKLQNELLNIRQQNSDLKTYTVELNDRLTKLQNDLLKSNVTFSEECLKYTENKHTSPSSLLNICLNNVKHIIYKDQSESLTETTSSSMIEYTNSETQTDFCEYKDVLSLKEENSVMKEELEKLAAINVNLYNDLKYTSHELELFTAASKELDKKISNHRTNLSTLTATMYAENNLLKCKVKDLQHCLSLTHNVSQLYIPDMKRLLTELQNTLQNQDLCPIKTLNNDFKRFSLPDILEKNSTFTTLRNESNMTLDADLLMLDTNVTLSTTIESLNQEQTYLNNTQGMFYNDTHQKKDVIEEEDDPTDNSEFISKDGVDVNDTLESAPNNEKYFALNIQPISPGLAPKVVEELQHSICRSHSENLEIAEKLHKSNLEYEQNIIPENETMEMDYRSNAEEVLKIKEILTFKLKEIKSLQHENINLSMNVTDYIAEVDDLKKEIDELKIHNKLLSDEQSSSNTVSNVCDKCLIKDRILNSLKSNENPDYLKCNPINADNSFDKYVNIQNACKEDCKLITVEVATIKNHLERNNLSISRQTIDLHESISDLDMFALNEKHLDEASNVNFNNDVISNNIDNKSNSLELYILDKNECIKYYIQKTSSDDNLFDSHTKIIEIMELLYDKLVNKHGSEVENLQNKLLLMKESDSNLQSQIDGIKLLYEETCKKLETKENMEKKYAMVIENLKLNIEEFNAALTNDNSIDSNKLMNHLNKQLLPRFEKELSLPLSLVFDNIIAKISNNEQNYLSEIKHLQDKIEGLVKELNSATQSLLEMKKQNKKNEIELYNLQKEKELMHQISSAVTLDIIKKEEVLNDAINKGLNTLLDIGIITEHEKEVSASAMAGISLQLEGIVTKYAQSYREQLQKLNEVEEEKKNLLLRVTKSEANLQEKDQELLLLQQQSEAMNIELNNCHKNTIADLESRIDEYKQEMSDYSIKQNEIKNFINKISQLESENNDLKQINSVITIESNKYKLELEQTDTLLQSQNQKLKTYEHEISDLNHCLKDKLRCIEELKIHTQKIISESEDLRNRRQLLQNEVATIQKELQLKTESCNQLQLNITTHVKSAEILNNSLKRLQKQNEEQTAQLVQKDKTIETLTADLATVREECRHMSQRLDDALDEIEMLKYKNTLENDLMVLDGAAQGRGSLESSKIKRHSIHDANRILVNVGQLDVESVFSARSPPRDVFLDCEPHSGRSTPTAATLRRNSYLSPELVNEENVDSISGSRLSNVNMIRRRRQSLHDKSRNSLPDALMDVDTKPTANTSNIDASEMSTLKSMLQSCQEELEVMRVKYQKLDQECEICGQYLKEREAQCDKLTSDKLELEERLAEALLKMGSGDRTNTEQDCNEGSASVISRVSYNLQLEKNKMLSQDVERAQQSNRDLKAKYDSEVSTLNSRLQSYQQELEQLQVKYREVDEECEICSQYLKERENECDMLTNEKVALESRVATMAEQLSQCVCADRDGRGSVKVHVAVNTDQDWSNLHAVVVDRMSFDAEVEKNRQLTNALKEFHQKNRDLRASLTHAHKKLEKESNTKQLESKLQSYKEEILVLRKKCQQMEEDRLHEEMRANAEQSWRLADTKSYLETKTTNVGVSEKILSSKKKRQSLHDQNRHNKASSEVSTTATEDVQCSLISNTTSLQLDLDDHQLKELKSLREQVKSLLREKELQQRSQQTLYVSTGSAIVQNQQITDVMKENQKLKKVNAKLVHLCKKRGTKCEENIENEHPHDN